METGFHAITTGARQWLICLNKKKHAHTQHTHMRHAQKQKTNTVIISINLPGLSGRSGRMRIPLLVLPDHNIGPNTFDDFFEVCAYSMRHLLINSHPTERHDHSAWGRGDEHRKLRIGPLGFHACCNQVRADWDWLGKCFHFPFHNVHAGMCWRCNILRNQVQSHKGWAAWFGFGRYALAISCELGLLEVRQL
jgi:hypothetical protein